MDIIKSKMLHNMLTCYLRWLFYGCH